MAKKFRYGDKVRIKPDAFDAIAAACAIEGITRDMVGTLDVPRLPGIWKWIADFGNGKRFGFEEYELEHVEAVQDGE